MTQFGIGVTFWAASLLCMLYYDKRSDDTLITAEVAHLAVCVAYLFWGIGWTLAWVADVIKLAVL